MADIDLDAPVTAKEMMAIVIARDLKDGEWVEVGANLPVPRAGALLAHLLHGPNMNVMLAMTRAWVRDEPSIEDFAYITDVRAQRWAEAYYEHDRLLNDLRIRRNGVFFAGGLEIDRYGNSNLIATGEDHARPAFRGPGGIGTCNATAVCSRYHLVTTSHSKRVLVERCAFVSALGFGDGSRGLRKRLGLPGSGPRYIITPLCVFDFDPTTNAARLRSVHPGVTKEMVASSTGFSFECAPDFGETPGPTHEELSVLRGRVDRRGDLRA